MIFTAKQIRQWDCDTEKDGQWIPARPVKLGLVDRVKSAWFVLIGKCDALDWQD